MTSTSLADFSSAFERLEATGKNWVTFRQRFQIAVKQKDVWEHFDGTSPRLTPADPAKATPAELTTITTWDKKESLVMYLITQKLPDITFTKHARKGTAAAIWAAIIQEFTLKSLLLRANLCTQFLTMRATTGANLHTKLDHVRVKYEELLTNDITVSEAEYAALIINFLPDDMSTFVSQVSATAKLAHGFQTSSPALADSDMPTEEAPAIKATTLMEIALEEWDRRTSGSQRAKAKLKDVSVAASVISTEKPKLKGCRGPQKPVGVCWNCGGKGHRQDQCPSPQQDSDAKGKDSSATYKPNASKSIYTKPKNGNANTTTTAAVASLDEIVGTWSAYISLPKEFVYSDSSDDKLAGLFDDDAHSDITGLTEQSDMPSDANSMPSLQTVLSTTDSESSHNGEDAPVPTPVLITARLSAVAN